jgi:hypothetical protein
MMKENRGSENRLSEHEVTIAASLFKAEIKASRRHG